MHQRCGEFVISLDFELMWGMRDCATQSSYGDAVLGGRVAIPRMLDMFASNNVAATWAIVGFLFCEDKEHLLASCPPSEMLPQYSDPVLSNYTAFSAIGNNEKDDPYHYGASLVRQIAQTPRQEIATHTFSHYYCLEPGQTQKTLTADLQAALRVAEEINVPIQSIIFPRNQYTAQHVETCKAVGINVFRGCPPAWAHSSSSGEDNTKWRRAIRLMDTYVNVCGHLTYDMSEKADGDVRASRFLRPWSKTLSVLHPLHIARVKQGMTEAAQKGRGFHLWWHPHNFGAAPEQNLACLQEVVAHYIRLQDEYGMQSRTMGEAYAAR